MENVMKIYTDYGEIAPNGAGPNPAAIADIGTPYLEEHFPKLDYVKTARVIPSPLYRFLLSLVLPRCLREESLLWRRRESCGERVTPLTRRPRAIQYLTFGGMPAPR